MYAQGLREGRGIRWKIHRTTSGTPRAREMASDCLFLLALTQVHKHPVMTTRKGGEQETCVAGKGPFCAREGQVIRTTASAGASVGKNSSPD